jgi:HlyD family secretion protein
MKRLLAAIIALTLLAGCAQAGAKPTPTPTPSATKKVSSGGASAQGYVTPVRAADLAFRTGGRVVQVMVKEGDLVKAGQPLVKLQDADLKAALAQAQADLARLQAGARPEEIAQAQAELQVAEGQVAAAAAELERIESGAPRAADLAAAQAQLAEAEAQLKPTQDAYNNIRDGRELCKEYNVGCGALGLRLEQQAVLLEAAQTAYNAAQKNVVQAQANAGADLRTVQSQLGIATGQRDAALAQLNLLKAGSTTEQIDSAQARVAQAQAALDEATLLAPFDGTIAELPIHIGENVSPGVLVASIADLSNWQVETDDLSEVDVVNVQSGADVSITVDALPGVTLKGKVTSITPRSAIKRGDVTYTVKIAITDPDPHLKWGMTAFVDIQGK